MTSDCKN